MRRDIARDTSLGLAYCRDRRVVAFLLRAMLVGVGLMGRERRYDSSSAEGVELRPVARVG